MAKIPEAGRTRRQEIVALLSEREHSFEELRGALRGSLRRLEEDLHHVERSLRRRERPLVVTPPRCLDCGFEFRRREHFHRPSRCPRCRSEQISDARLRI